jgi:hypothetical protein
MNTPNRAVLSNIQERDVQLAFVQLVETSLTFREWAINQIVPELQQAKFDGVSHSVSDYFGETDIELRLRDEHGTVHFLLVECKVDSAFGSDQIERYFKRGEKYQEKDFCDEFSVGLLAPEAYAGKADEFDGIITFETITERVDQLSHDGAPYFRALYEKASRKESGTDKASVMSRIESRVYNRLNEFTIVDDPRATLEFEAQNRFNIRSTHPAHPDNMRYSVSIYFDQRTMFCGIGIFDTPDDIHGQASDILAQHFDELDLDDALTELSDRRLKSQGLVKKRIPVPDDPTAVSEAHIEEAATAVIELVNHYHPKIVKEFR